MPAARYSRSGRSWTRSGRSRSATRPEASPPASTTSGGWSCRSSRDLLVDDVDVVDGGRAPRDALAEGPLVGAGERRRDDRDAVHREENRCPGEVQLDQHGRRARDPTAPCLLEGALLRAPGAAVLDQADTAGRRADDPAIRGGVLGTEHDARLAMPAREHQRERQ